MSELSSLENLVQNLQTSGLHVPLFFRGKTASGEVIPVENLLDESTLRSRIARAAERMNSDNLLAAASLFQKWYTSTLLSSVLTPLLTAQTGILAYLEQTELVLENDLPAGIRLSESVQWVSLSTKDAGRASRLRSKVYQALFDDNLGRLIYKIAEAIGLSPMIMWGNAGNYIGYLYEQFVKDTSQGLASRQDLDALLNSSGSNTPRFSSTYQTIWLEEATPPQSVRVRNTCCLRYQFPGCQSCLTCPRLSREERVEMINSKYK